MSSRDPKLTFYLVKFKLFWLALIMGALGHLFPSAQVCEPAMGLEPQNFDLDLVVLTSVCPIACFISLLHNLHGIIWNPNLLSRCKERVYGHGVFPGERLQASQKSLVSKHTIFSEVQVVTYWIKCHQQLFAEPESRFMRTLLVCLQMCVKYHDQDGKN